MSPTYSPRLQLLFEPTRTSFWKGGSSTGPTHVHSYRAGSGLVPKPNLTCFVVPRRVILFPKKVAWAQHTAHDFMPFQCPYRAFFSFQCHLYFSTPYVGRYAHIVVHSYRVHHAQTVRSITHTKAYTTHARTWTAYAHLVLYTHQNIYDTRPYMNCVRSPRVIHAPPETITESSLSMIWMNWIQQTQASKI